MAVMKRFKANADVGQIPRKADTFKLRVERPFCNGIIRQRVKYIRRDRFTTGKVYDADRAAVNTVSEEQDLEVRAFRVFVNTAFRQAHRRIRLYINFKISHVDPPK